VMVCVGLHLRHESAHLVVPPRINVGHRHALHIRHSDRVLKVFLPARQRR
jgi:hypothetical protein